MALYAICSLFALQATNYGVPLWQGWMSAQQGDCNWQCQDIVRKANLLMIRRLFSCSWSKGRRRTKTSWKSLRQLGSNQYLWQTRTATTASFVWLVSSPLNLLFLENSGDLKWTRGILYCRSADIFWGCKLKHTKRKVGNFVLLQWYLPMWTAGSGPPDAEMVA